MDLSRDDVLKFLSSKTRAELGGVTDTTELFSTGLVDSFTMVDLRFWLEKKTGKRVAPEELSVEKLDTIERILAFAAEHEKRG